MKKILFISFTLLSITCFSQNISIDVKSNRVRFANNPKDTTINNQTTLNNIISEVNAEVVSQLGTDTIKAKNSISLRNNIVTVVDSVYYDDNKRKAIYCRISLTDVINKKLQILRDEY